MVTGGKRNGIDAEARMKSAIASEMEPVVPGVNVRSRIPPERPFDAFRRSASLETR